VVSKKIRVLAQTFLKTILLSNCSFSEGKKCSVSRRESEVYTLSPRALGNFSIKLAKGLQFLSIKIMIFNGVHLLVHPLGVAPEP